MHHLIYLSSAVEAFTPRQLEDLLTRSRHNNSQRGITGLLLYHDGNFFQVIEGEHEEIAALYNRIKSDMRHHDFTVLFDEEIPERNFGEWSMAYRDLSTPAELEGFNDLLNHRNAKDRLEEYPGQVRAFMKMFV